MHRYKLTKEKVIFNLIAGLYLSLFAVLCLFPFLIIISGAFSSETSILEYGYSLIPREFSTAAFRAILTYPAEILNAYGVTIFITAVGTGAGIALSTMAAYVLQRKCFRYRNVLSFLFYFTTIFDGGIVPKYILMIRYLGLKNNVLALILPLLINVFYIIIVRSFISSAIPESLVESAQIDGAGEFQIFSRIVMPLSKPILATIGLFMALGYWNDWFNAMLYIDDRRLIPLQYYLYKMLSQITMLRELVSKVPQLTAVTPPEESFKMAMTLITIGPILLLYPFIQKYFVSGIMIGAVKG
ncbi:carbohydrate ABC transporter permease [Lachnoclostridium sp. Marseille-P6806]|uniref:carbohydrate ABC transporter permease n=1 Tax=Lachnoclostridium sp. Marseille-P6806 TaxID=2364793 RepID=UPI0010326AC9|nr:carbohydrate ABC transporter permease [Lachnoclostridium sp. Marseille-P6806]